MGELVVVDSDDMDALCARIAANESQIEKLLANPVVVPEQEICEGPFIGSTGRTGWLHGWSPVTQNANVPQVLTEWMQVGREVTGPDCVHDAKLTLDVGNHYFLLRRIRAYLWIDVRVLRNGVACHTESYDAYEYHDERQDTNPDVIPPLRYLIEKPGNSNLTCLNGPANAVYTVEVRYRYQGASFQPSSYFRYIGGLRSEGDLVFQPKNIVIGRL